MLLVSSDRQTVHVFKLEHPEGTPAQPQPQTWGAYFASFLPTVVGGYWTQGWSLSPIEPPTSIEYVCFAHRCFPTERSFLQFNLPRPGFNHLCALTGDKSRTDMNVISEDGYFGLHAFVKFPVLHKMN